MGHSFGTWEALEEEVGLWREISCPPGSSDVFKRKPEIWTFV